MFRDYESEFSSPNFVYELDSENIGYITTYTIDLLKIFFTFSYPQF